MISPNAHQLTENYFELLRTPERPTEIAQELLSSPDQLIGRIDRFRDLVSGVSSCSWAQSSEVTKDAILRYTGFLVHHSGKIRPVLESNLRGTLDSSIAQLVLEVHHSSGGRGLDYANIDVLDRFLPKPLPLVKYDEENLSKLGRCLSSSGLLSSPSSPVLQKLEAKWLLEAVTLVIGAYGIEKVPLRISDSPPVKGSRGAVFPTGTIEIYPNQMKIGEFYSGAQLLATALHEARHIIQLGAAAIAVKKMPKLGSCAFAPLARANVPQQYEGDWDEDSLRRVAVGFFASEVSRPELNYYAYRSLWIEQDARDFSETIMRSMGWTTISLDDREVWGQHLGGPQQLILP
jgi:hypothetical protein